MPRICQILGDRNEPLFFNKVGYFPTTIGILGSIFMFYQARLIASRYGTEYSPSSLDLTLLKISLKQHIKEIVNSSKSELSMSEDSYRRKLSLISNELFTVIYNSMENNCQYVSYPDGYQFEQKIQHKSTSFLFIFIFQHGCILFNIGDK